jgi:thiol:disulfide interchange protein DsbD
LIPITAAVIAGSVGLRAGADRRRGHLARAVVASFIYVMGLALVYALLGLVSASLGAVVRTWLQSALVRIPMAALLVLLALVMLDAVGFGNVAGPGAWLQRLGGRGGIVGLFFVGMGAGLVASPCLVAPLVGILTYVAQTGDRWMGFWTLFAMAWGMSIVLILAGVFSGGLLPRAGAWMYTVRNLIGFLLLWAALWALRPLIPDSVYVMVTGLIVMAGVVYVGALDALTAESGFMARTGRFLGLVALVLGVGLFLLGLVELTHLEFTHEETPALEFRSADARVLDAVLATDEPVLLDFAADWCVLCRELEETVFKDPSVLQEADGFRLLRVDVDRNADLVRRYRIFGVPTLLVFSANGDTPSDRLDADINAGTLISALRKARRAL